MKIYSIRRPLSGLCMILAIAASSFGQKMMNTGTPVKSGFETSAPSASVQPVVIEGNVKCSDLNTLHVNGQGDIRFSHIITNDELKLNFADPNGTFPFSNSAIAPFPRVIVGTEYPTRSVTITSSSNPGVVSSWSSQLPITAVNVKVGSTSYVYPYKPFAISDTNLATGDNRGISHITFCYGEPTGVTAGEGSISGRVVDSSGRGIAKAQLVLVNGATGETKITLTSPFGYYTIEGLDVSELYVLNVNHKSFEFAEKQRTVMLMDSVTDVDFVGQQ